MSLLETKGASLALGFQTVINSVQNRFARQDTEVELRQDTDLSKAIPNTITDYLGMATTSRELLLGGWVQWQYTRCFLPAVLTRIELVASCF